MKLEDLKIKWSEDSKIDSHKVVEESIRVPLLHSEWLNIMFDIRRKNRLLSEKKKQLESDLIEYFEGRLDGKDIGREPFQGIAKTQSKIDKLITNDSEFRKLSFLISENEDCILFIKEVLDMIHKRGFTLKTIVDWRKFESGA